MNKNLATPRPRFEIMGNQPGDRSVARLVKNMPKKHTKARFGRRGQNFSEVANRFYDAWIAPFPNPVSRNITARDFDDWCSVTPDPLNEDGEVLNPYYLQAKGAPEGPLKDGFWKSSLDRRTRIRDRINKAARRPDRPEEKRFTLETVKGKKNVFAIIMVGDIVNESIENLRATMAAFTATLIGHFEYDLWCTSESRLDDTHVLNVLEAVRELDQAVYDRLNSIQRSIEVLKRFADAVGDGRYNTTLGLGIQEAAQLEQK